MFEKARALGLQFDEAVARQYAHPLDAQYALNKFHESWNLGWGIPIRRKVPLNAAISNSVVVRCQTDPEWRPKNLEFEGASIASSYSVVPVVGQLTMAATKTA
jgi:hypothetical protein